MEHFWNARRVTAIVAILGAAGLGTVITSVPASADNNFCGWTPANNSRIAGRYSYDGVNIRTGGDVGCPSRGQSLASDHLEIRCISQNNDGYWWDYLVDFDRGIVGWSRDDLVVWLQGNPVHC